MPFNKMFKPVHAAKLKTFNPKTKALKNAPVLVNLQHPDLKIWKFENLMIIQTIFAQTAPPSSNWHIFKSPNYHHGLRH
jgi:hypothetical protein